MPSRSDPLIPWAPEGLSLVLIRCARLALERQRAIAPVCKPDGTLVTPADTDIEAMLEDFLPRALPGSRLIGEETLGDKGADYLSAALAGTCWVVDPVDGTVLYAMGMPGWGISLAYLENGRLAHGVVVYPQTVPGGEWLQFRFTDAAGGVTDAQAIRPSGADGETAEKDLLARLVVSAQALRDLPVVDGYPGLFAVSHRVAKRALYRGRHPLVSMGACVSCFRHLMDGGVVGYYVKMKLWDVAAVLPMAWRRGLRACRSDGSPLSLDLDPATWVLDPTRPDFLSLTDHVLFYRADRVGPELLDDFSWPEGQS